MMTHLSYQLYVCDVQVSGVLRNRVNHRFRDLNELWKGTSSGGNKLGNGTSCGIVRKNLGTTISRTIPQLVPFHSPYPFHSS